MLLLGSRHAALSPLSLLQSSSVAPKSTAFCSSIPSVFLPSRCRAASCTLLCSELPCAARARDRLPGWAANAAAAGLRERDQERGQEKGKAGTGRKGKARKSKGKQGKAKEVKEKGGNNHEVESPARGHAARCGIDTEAGTGRGKQGEGKHEKSQRGESSCRNCSRRGRCKQPWHVAVARPSN